MKTNRSVIFIMFSAATFLSSFSYSEVGVWDTMKPVWVDGGNPAPDTYAAFRGAFELSEAAEVEIRFLGASWFNVWLDGEFFAEGPARFPREFPEYDERRISLAKGSHLLAVQATYLGVETRLLDDIPPFWACEVRRSGQAQPIEWRAIALPGYAPRVRRINPQLGWIEWLDTNPAPENWRGIDFDGSQWPKAAPVNPRIGAARPLSIASVPFFVHTVKPIAQGPLAEFFGYERDDIPAWFYLRDLVCDRLPAQGVWRRYDLERVRLARPRFTLDLPKGAAVEFAYSETLSQGRVAPYINLSAGPSCNLDHYVARGGEQEFFPLTPRGGRFVEIHVFADPGQIKFVEEEFIERCYFDKPEGSFRCGDELLERIWTTGVETLRGCSEDAVIDNPSRERGEWTGDVSAVALDIAAAAYSDVRLCRRALAHSAQCAREDGLVAGLCPGGEAYIPSYSAQWVSGCLNYWEITGDRSVLEELYPYAEKNLHAFERCMTPGGIVEGLGWIFIDWGYVPNPGPSDMALNLHYLAAARDMIRWCEILGKSDRVAYYREREQTMRGILQRWFDEQLKSGAEGWNQIGYHRAVLGLRQNFFSGEQERACVEYIKAHILRCFPNDPSAPRNSDPTHNHPQLITPYFAHYAFPALIERGEMNFVLDQYRKCWGWALQDGRTTWVEVFDVRWSHCHQWAGCPTGQLSHYVLGLHPRFDLGKNHYEFSLEPGGLEHAEGMLPIPNSPTKEAIKIHWIKQTDGFDYDLEIPEPIVIHVTDAQGYHPRILTLERSSRLVIRGKDIQVSDI